MYFEILNNIFCTERNDINLPRTKKTALQKMPIVPIRGMTIFPYMSVHFDIGREKSVLSIEDALDDNKLIFATTQHDMEKDDPENIADINTIGTVCVIKQVIRMPNNVLRVLLEGSYRGRLKKFYDDAPFFEAEIEILKDDEKEATLEQKAMMRGIADLFEEYVSIGSRTAPEIISILNDIPLPGKFCDIVCAHMLLTTEQRQELLEKIDIDERLEKLHDILTSENKIVKLEQKIHQRVRREMTKSEKTYYLREQIKAINKELGEYSDSNLTDAQEFRKKLESLEIPEKIREKISKEISKLEREHRGSADAEVSRNYLETFFDLPWNNSSKEKIDLKNCAKILDKDHFGLEKVKDRIIEYLAVRKLSSNLKSPILCFVGPPGVGKTSIAKSIANSINREFARISLGGVRDEAEIRGHRRTYIGAIPGRIVNALISVKTNNPVILFDEIDKMGADFKGNVESAMLEVLDPEQNKNFIDHYLEYEFDLSKIFFITTANTLDSIPRPLIDRMEIIQLSGYTEMEKLQIAKKYLIPKQLKEHNFTPKFIKISDEVLKKIISTFTRESGVRALEQKIARICRKVARKKVENPKLKSVTITMDELEALIGLTKAKREIREISDFAKVQKARQAQGLPTSDVSFHLVFTGNPGTGKTTVARLVAQIYKDLGIVSQGHLTEVSAKDLVAGYVGQTAIKTGEVIEKALGGVLFIDEAYTLLDKTGQGYGQEAIDTLLKEMEDKRDDFAVIVAGYDDLMHDFINSNPGLKSRFNKYVHFDDYSAEEMHDIFCLLCKKGAYTISEEAHDLIKKHFTSMCAAKDSSFANGRTVRNVFENIISKQASRIASDKNKTKELLSTIEAEDVQNCVGVVDEEEKLEDVLKEFNALTGLDKVKEEISELVYIVQNQQRRKARGLRVPKLSLHLVFMGNPGTGKTTVARCVARIYKCLGLLTKGQLIETDRSGLVAGYVGQTAIKTQDVIQTAIGGVLFVDEAYTLANGGSNDFGQEAIDTLLKAMEDQRDDLVVIVAGYDDLMDDFIHLNPGLESRFNRYIHFEDYTPDQMFSIFSGLCDKNQYVLSEDAVTKITAYFAETEIAKIGNGRGARNLFEKTVTQQAKRIERSSDEDVDLQEITAEDIDMAIRRG